MVQIVQEHEGGIDRGIITKISDYNSQVRDLVDQLHPIAKALDICQQDDTGLAQACEVWLDLLENPGLTQHKKAVNKIFLQAVKPCHFVAKLLHPKYQGQRLSEEQEKQAMDWLAEKNEDFVAAAIAFQGKSVPFSDYYFFNSYQLASCRLVERHQGEMHHTS